MGLWAGRAGMGPVALPEEELPGVGLTGLPEVKWWWGLALSDTPFSTASLPPVSSFTI